MTLEQIIAAVQDIKETSHEMAILKKAEALLELLSAPPVEPTQPIDPVS